MAADSTNTTETFLALDVAADGTVVGLSPTGAPMRRDRSSGAWLPLEGDWPPVARVAVGSARDLWALDSAGSVYRSGSDGPTPVAGRLVSIDVGADGSVWGIDADGRAVRYGADQSWLPVPAPPGLRRVSVGDRLVAVVDEAGAVHIQRDQEDWQSLGGPFRDASVGGDGALYVINADGRVSTFLDEDTSEGRAVLGVADGMLAVAVGSASDIWCLLDDGRAIDLTDGRALFSEAGHRHVPGQVGWDAEDVFDDTLSTHLWIVHQAARLAALDLDPGGRQIYELINPDAHKTGDPFHDQLCQGLYDADFVDKYRGPLIWDLQPTYAGHFYDPDTGLNWLNDSNNTARNNCQTYGVLALNNWIEFDGQGHPRLRPAADRGPAGYNLGLALHYLTDLTQPMHACNFTQLSSWPTKMYHGAVETYAMDHQGVVGLPPLFESPGPGPSDNPCPQRESDNCGNTCVAFDRYAHAAARRSKDRHASKLIDVSEGHYWGWDLDPGYWTGVVDPLVKPMLQDAIRVTAQFLVSWTASARRSLTYFDACGARWQRTQGYLTDISAAADGSVWGVGRRYPDDQSNVFRRTGSGWDAVPGHLTSVAVGSSDQVWGVDTQLPVGADNVFRWTGSNWQAIKNTSLTSIAVASDGQVWGINARNPVTMDNIYRWTGSQWTVQQGYLTSISVARGGALWGVNTTPVRSSSMSNVFQLTDSGWELKGDKFLTEVAVADDGTVWGLNAVTFAGTSNVVQWNGESWEDRDGYLVQLANGGAGKVWGINPDQVYGDSPYANIYRWDQP